MLSLLRFEVIHTDCWGIFFFEERLTDSQVCLHLRVASSLGEGQMLPNLFLAEARILSRMAGILCDLHPAVTGRNISP